MLGFNLCLPVSHRRRVLSAPSYTWKRGSCALVSPFTSIVIDGSLTASTPRPSSLTLLFIPRTHPLNLLAVPLHLHCITESSTTYGFPTTSSTLGGHRTSHRPFPRSLEDAKECRPHMPPTPRPHPSCDVCPRPVRQQGPCLCICRIPPGEFSLDANRPLNHRLAQRSSAFPPPPYSPKSS